MDHWLCDIDPADDAIEDLPYSPQTPGKWMWLNDDDFDGDGLADNSDNILTEATGAGADVGHIQISLADLSGTQVTDAGVAHLAGLSNLQQLSLVATQVIDAGVAKFSEKLPDLRVIR